MLFRSPSHGPAPPASTDPPECRRILRSDGSITRTADRAEPPSSFPPSPVRPHRIHLPKPTGHRRCPTPNESPSDCRDDSPHGTKSPGTGHSSPPGMRPRLSRSDPVLYRPVSFRPPAPNALYAFRKTRRTDGPAAAIPYLNGPTFCMAFSGPADNIRDTGHGSRTESLPRSGERSPPETQDG